jgi:hypothetical protein
MKLRYHKKKKPDGRLQAKIFVAAAEGKISQAGTEKLLRREKPGQEKTLPGTVEAL